MFLLYCLRLYLRRYRFWHWFAAWQRLDPGLVCAASVGRGFTDYHDYPDSIEGEPWHFQELTCRRCGKRFMI